MSIFQDIRDLVAPTDAKPQPQKYFILPDGYAAAQFTIGDDKFYSIYIGLNHWENKSALPEGSKVHNRETAIRAAAKLDDTLRERLREAIDSNTANITGFYVKIKGAVKYDMQYTDEEDFLAHKRELQLQGYKVDDKITFTLNAKDALAGTRHRTIIDKRWEHSSEYSKRKEAKAAFLEKICQDILHDDFATAPEERF